MVCLGLGGVRFQRFTNGLPFLAAEAELATGWRGPRGLTLAVPANPVLKPHQDAVVTSADEAQKNVELQPDSLEPG